MAGQKYSNRAYVERARERMVAASLPQISDDVIDAITTHGEEYAAAIDPGLEQQFEADMAAVRAELRRRWQAQIIASGGSLTEDD